MRQNVFRIFAKCSLADGDALIVPQEQLVKSLTALYLSSNILEGYQCMFQLKALKLKPFQIFVNLKKKMSLAYIGFETGDEYVYKMIRKYGSPSDNVRAVEKLKAAKIKVNVTVILGLGGKKYSKYHALNTAKILNEAKPEQIAALTLMVEKNVPLYEMIIKGEFSELTEFESLEELKLLLKGLEGFQCLFFSNHASNYVPLELRLPKRREGILLLENILKEKTRMI